MLLPFDHNKKPMATADVVRAVSWKSGPLSIVDGTCPSLETSRMQDIVVIVHRREGGARDMDVRKFLEVSITSSRTSWICPLADHAFAPYVESNRRRTRRGKIALGA